MPDVVDDGAEFVEGRPGFGHQRRDGPGADVVHDFERRRGLEDVDVRPQALQGEPEQCAVVSIDVEHDDSGYGNQGFVLFIGPPDTVLEDMRSL